MTDHKVGEYDDIEFQTDLAKYSVQAGAAAAAGFGLLLSSIATLVAIITLGKIDDFDKLVQAGSLAYATIFLIISGLIVTVLGSAILSKKINEARDRLRKAKEGAPEIKKSLNSTIE